MILSTYIFILYSLTGIIILLFCGIVGVRTLITKLHFMPQTRLTQPGLMPYVTKDIQVRHLSGPGRVPLSPGWMIFVTKGIRMFISWLFRIIKDLIVWCDRWHSTQDARIARPHPPIGASKMSCGELERKTNVEYLSDHNKVYNTYNTYSNDVRIERYREYWCRGVSFLSCF